MAKVAIVSLRCNPAFIQFLLAYAKAFRQLGYDAEFLLHPGYSCFAELENAAPILYHPRAPLTSAWTHAVFLNPSVENLELANALKQRGTKILYVFHEPWHMSLAWLRDEGMLGTLRGIVAHHVTVPCLRIADTVILASQYGLSEYRRADAKFNPSCAYFPLILDDEAPANIAELLPRKHYFGYLGSLGRSHGFDQYLCFMRFAFQRNMDVRFLIASRQPLPERLLNDSIFRRNLDKIEIRCGRPLGNDEMNLCYTESFCVWNLYRRSTQSAVLPKAFMFGTPVIASAIGSFPEYIEDGVNGRFAAARDHLGIWIALEDMRKNLGAYAVNCRRTFLDAFYYGSHLSDLERLLK